MKNEKNKEIKKLIKKGLPLIKIAKQFNVSRQFVWQLTRGGEKYQKEYQKEYQKKYTKTEKNKEWAKTYRETSPVYKKWMDDNKEKKKAKENEYQKSKKYLRYRRKYEQTDKRKEYRKEYYKNRKLLTSTVDKKTKVI